MLEVAVFSFNRGDYLRNCVESIQRNMPGIKVTIYDDNSTDPDTVATIRALALPVYRPDPGVDRRHGGLYDNMQAALDRAVAPVILFVQDDMQIVRPVLAADLATIADCFAADPEVAFICPFFIKATRRTRYGRLLTPSDRGRYYVPSELAKTRLAHKKMAYFDAVLINVARLYAVGWQFGQAEGANVVEARKRFSHMPVLADPFMFFCPEVPFFRNRKQAIAARIARRVVGEDVKRFIEMTEAEVAALRARPMEVLPVAEDFLRTANLRVRRPFVYKDVAARWWLYGFHKLEQRLTKRR